MRLPLALLAAVLLLAACSTGKRDMSGQASRGFAVPDYEILWDVAGKEMARAGFPPDLDASNRDGRVLVSRWQVQLMQFAGRGWREQATLRLVPVEGQANRWTVEANVTREYNTEVKEPSNPAKAKWESPERIGTKERQIVYGIETFFIGHDVSPRFRTDYDMPAASPVIAPTK
jgi:hypothetical protein